MTRPYCFEPRVMPMRTASATTSTASQASLDGGSTEPSRSGLSEAVFFYATLGAEVKPRSAQTQSKVNAPRRDSTMLLRGLASTFEHWIAAAEAGRMELGTPEAVARLVAEAAVERALDYVLIEPAPHR